MDTPWELDLERALVSQLAECRDLDLANDDGEKNEFTNDENCAAQRDELTALASIFGNDLSGPAAAGAKRTAFALEGGDEGEGIEGEGEGIDEGEKNAAGERLLRFDLEIDFRDTETPTRVFLERRNSEQPALNLPVGLASCLPTVRLSVIFPKTYPSKRAPVFALSASWVPRFALNAAATSLDEIWNACPGDAVVFSWVEYLRERAVSDIFLCAVDGERHVKLRARDGWRGDDASPVSQDASSQQVVRGVPRARSPDEALQVLLRTCAVNRVTRYARALHTCGVCFCDDVSGTQMRRSDGRVCCFDIPTLKSQETASTSQNTDGESTQKTEEKYNDSTQQKKCTHAFCVECLSAMAKLHVAEGAVGALRCPESKCGASLAPATIKDVLCFGDDSGGASATATTHDASSSISPGAALFERYEKLSLERGLASMADLVYCPRCDAAVLEDEGDHCGQCVQCQYAFCTLCREGWHPGTVCLSPSARMRVLEARARGGKAGQNQSDEARRKHREQVADAMALRYVEREGKRCPTCGAGVVKSEGCNKMHCVVCEHYFCYKCGEGVVGYEHFREGGRCSLFDVEAIAAWEREVNAGLVVAEARERDAHVMGLAVRETRCPACRQPNFKLGGNNHIGCWSCGQHYCHTCRVVVRRGGDTRAHYGAGAGKCRQHTNE